MLEIASPLSHSLSGMFTTDGYQRRTDLHFLLCCHNHLPSWMWFKYNDSSFYLWQFVAELDQESEGGESSVLAFVYSCWYFSHPCFLCLHWSSSTLFCSCVFIHTLIKISEKGNFLFVFNYMWDSVSLLLHYVILSPSYFLGCHVPPHPSETLQHHSLHHRQRAPARLLQR